MGDAEQALRAQVERLQRQQGAIVQLARAGVGRDFDAALAELTRVAAQTIGVERHSVWLLSADRQDLTCVKLYEQSRDAHSGGTVLSASQYFRYFSALETGRAIDAHDAREDARTSEFRDGYLVPLGITSMMDAAIRVDGEVVGVVCNEHVGPKRTWTTDEVSFAGAVADQVALLFVENERERMRQAMLHTQKLESLGLLAGGLAHDFNNLLTVIMGNAAFARDGVPPGPARDALEDLVRSAQHATHLTKQLLAYSGRSPTTVVAVDLSRRVRDVARLVQASVPARVRWTLKLAEKLPAVIADAAQVSQVVMNLLMNAGEAMGDSPGEVRASTGVHEVTPSEATGLVASPEFRPGRLAYLQVEDDGCGLDRAALGRIFDPFYTTKGAGRGLGLAAVLGIVRSHAGAISVTSEPGRGSTFRVYFPIRDSAPPPSAPPPPSEQAPPPARRGTVLVVDDQHIVRAFAERALRGLGYDVMLAGSGPEGIGRYREKIDGIDLILLDLTMPGMNGIEAYNEIIKIKADVPLILMSGFDERDATRGLEEQGLVVFLPKPFTPDQLAAKVKQALKR